MKNKRVLLKLSGEALAGPKKTGFDEDTVREVARQVKISVEAGVQVGIVIGGGNFWRGRTSNAIDRTKADQIGMLATVMNCIYASEIFRTEGMKTAILTPFACGSMTELFPRTGRTDILKRALLYFSQEAPATRIFPPIQASYCGRWRWRRTASFLQKPSTAYMTAIRRSILRRKSTSPFPLRK